MARWRLYLNAVFAAILFYWAANVIYTATKALSMPFNGSVEQYLSVDGQNRIAAAVDLARMERDLMLPATRISALDLIHACHAEICRQFSVGETDATGIDHLLETKTGLCFDYCGATYALALYTMRTHTHLIDKPKYVRWVRGFVSTADTLGSAHSWLEAVDARGRWRGYDACIDLQTRPKENYMRPVGELLIKGRYFPLNRKQAGLGGHVTTSLAWKSILLGRKNIVDEVAARFSLPRFLILPGKAIVLVLLSLGVLAGLRTRLRRQESNDGDLAHIDPSPTEPETEEE
ncbi:MAG: hypothetical protein GXP25_12685 [Planctomycetes bacterium]|nr:hypothetical protein [Planctomycetota bacterium]